MLDGESGLKNVPGLVLRVINEELWRERIIAQTGERVQFQSFAGFVVAEPLDGLGTDLRTLKRLCADSPVALDAIVRETTGRQGHKTNNDNVMVSKEAEQGNSSEYALRRLRKDRPDLHERVRSGEMSPHAAAVEAGFRRRTIQIPADPYEAAAALGKRFSRNDLVRLVELLALQIAE